MVLTLAVSSDQSKVFLGGPFDKVNGVAVTGGRRRAGGLQRSQSCPTGSAGVQQCSGLGPWLTRLYLSDDDQRLYGGDVCRHGLPVGRAEPVVAGEPDRSELDDPVQRRHAGAPSSQGPWSLASDAGHLYLGGDFSTVAGVAQPHYAVFTDSALVSVPYPPTDLKAQPTTGAGRSPAARTGKTRRARHIHYTKLAITVPLSLLLWWLIGRAGALIAVPAAVFGLPILLSPPPGGADLNQLTALEGWTRSLASMIRGGQSLRQTLTASLASCPAPIRREVTDLVRRLGAGVDTERALDLFG